MRETVRRCCAACLAAGLPLAAYAAGDAGLNVTLNRQELFLGESLLMQVHVSGATDTPPPDLSAITNASIHLQGSAPQNRSSTTIINGQVRTERFLGRIFYYEIMPAAAGVFMAGPVTAVVNGKRLTHPGGQVAVHGVEDQDIVRLSVEASRTAVLVDEPFEVTLSIRLQALQGQFASYEPLDPRNPPRIEAAYLDQAPIQGLVAPDIQQALQGLLASGNAPGFTLNQYTRQRDLFSTPFFGMGDPFREPARFRFARETVVTNNLSHNMYRFTLRYTPKQEGAYTFGPATFKGNVLVSVSAKDRPLARQFFAVGPAVVVRVVPPPEEGRPPSFIGAVGSNLTVEATLDTQTCNIGDPLTLTLSVAGNANLENVFPPDLSTVAGLTRSFRLVEGVQTQTKDGERRFIYTVRPTAAGTVELPPLPVSYYDVQARAYKTVHTQPLPVRVNETAVLTQTRVLISSETDAERTLSGAKAVLAVAPFDVRPDGFRPGAPWVPLWVILTVALAPLLFAASRIAGPAMAAARRLFAAGRRATALAQATAAIRTAAGAGDARAAAADVMTAVRRYCATRFDIAAAANMTPSEIGESLVLKGADPAHAGAVAQLLEEGAGVVFGGITHSDAAGAAWRGRMADALAAMDRRSA
jgi:hypothetical protein